jgi:FlaA1/EpsC-like NDP-sugar epimerase
MHNSMLILGAGGHGKVVADILFSQGISVRGFLDDSPVLVGNLVMGIPVLDITDHWNTYAIEGLILGIGSSAKRREIVDRLGHVAELWLGTQIVGTKCMSQL